MSWLGDVLKHFELSKAFTTAVFISSLVMLLGPRFFPGAMDVIPNQWRWLVGGACIFCGVLLIFWIIPSSSRWLLALLERLRNNPRINSLTPQETGFLVFLGESFPNNCVNVENISCDGVSRLEMLEMCAVLHRKGLVRINEYNDNLISLTAAGRKFALELMQAKNIGFYR